MSDSIRPSFDTQPSLPPGAPQVRLTAGAGSAGQKTWNIRRPITLLGARRPAHIVLHGSCIEKAHCIIINTGREVLLKNLHTNAGTCLDGRPIDLAIINDGSVAVLGATTLQFAITCPTVDSDDSAVGMEYTDPLKYGTSPKFFLEQTDQTFLIEEAAVLVGCHKSAGISLDHKDVSTRHAVIFLFAGAPAIFDLGSRTGTFVNGIKATFAALEPGDRIRIGPFTIRFGDIQQNVSASPYDLELPHAAPSAIEQFDALAQEKPVVGGVQAALKTTGSATSITNQNPNQSLQAIDGDLDKLRVQIGESWQRLNSWESQLRDDAAAQVKQDTDLTTRGKLLEDYDAELRGRLHDISVYHEQLAAREREAALLEAKLQLQEKAIEQREEAMVKQETELGPKTEELRRREHAISQRWLRVQQARCANCHKPFSRIESGPDSVK